MKSLVCYILCYAIIATHSWAQTQSYSPQRGQEVEVQIITGIRGYLNSIQPDERGELFNKMAEGVAQTYSFLDYLDQKISNGKMSSQKAKEIFLERISARWERQLKQSNLNLQDQEILKQHYTHKLQSLSFEEIHQEFQRADETMKTSGLTILGGLTVLAIAIVVVAIFYIIVRSIEYLVKSLSDDDDVQNRSYFQFVFQPWKK